MLRLIFEAVLVLQLLRNQRSAGGPGNDASVSPATTVGFQHRIDASYENLRRVIAWIGNADNKALIVLGFQGAIVAGVATAAGPLRTFLIGHPTPWPLWPMIALLAAFVVCFCVSLLMAFTTIYPDTKPRERDESRESPFFFGTISTMSLEKFTAKMHALDIAMLEDELIRQTHINAGIATRKFVSVKRASWFLGVELVFLLTSAIVVAATPENERAPQPWTATNEEIMAPQDPPLPERSVKEDVPAAP